MTAPTTLTQDTAGRVTAARALLRHPILSVETHPDELVLIRRHATALRSVFGALLGYSLVVEATFARLVKAPPSPAAPLRPLTRRSDDKPFTAATYTHLALVCAALLAPGAGDQILISALVDQIRADAAEQSIIVTDSIADRRHLVTSLGLLIDWGVVSETDGSVTAWGERREEEMLLSINRGLLVHLLPDPLYDVTDPSELWRAAPVEPPRRRLRRRLVEDPVVHRADLDADEIDVLSRERSELTRQLEDNFGLTLEVRAEGVLTYDTAGALTDLDFPGTGSAKQAALLLLDRLVASAPTSNDLAEVDGRQLSGRFAGWNEVDQVLAELRGQHGRSWRAAYAEDAGLLRADVVSLLVAVGLAAATPAGLVVFAPAARYRPRVVQQPPTLFDVT